MRSSVPRLLTLADRVGLRRMLAGNKSATGDLKYDGHLVGDELCGTLFPEPISPDWINELSLGIFRLSAIVSHSDCCEESRKQQPQSQVYFVNGICTSLNEHYDTLAAISSFTCHSVLGIYNGTRGFFGDALDVANELRLIQLAQLGRGEGERIPAVSTAVNILLAELTTSEEGAFELWAHSEGGLIASLALYEVEAQITASADLNAEQEGDVRIRRIQVRSFASAAPCWVEGPEYEHYVHVKDLTPNALGLGAASGVHRFGSAGALDLVASHSFRDVYLPEYNRKHPNCF
jgi:hypothetical protein